MQLLRQSAVNRNKTDKKQAFDYSARIYYQTDGHPQFKGLPIDHPDPEDIMAVEAYKARKEAHRRRPGKPSGGDAQKADRFSADKQRRKPPHTSSQQGSVTPRRQNENRRSGNDAPNHPESPSDTAKPQTILPENKKPVEIKREKRRRPPIKRPADTVVVSEIPVQEESTPNIPTPREEDYAGTALTSDRSAATILSDTRNRESNTNAIGNLHSDYAYNPAESATKESTDSETEAVNDLK